MEIESNDHTKAQNSISNEENILRKLTNDSQNGKGILLFPIRKRTNILLKVIDELSDFEEVFNHQKEEN